MNIVVMDDRIKTVMANKELANTTMSFRSWCWAGAYSLVLRSRPETYPYILAGVRILCGGVCLVCESSLEHCLESLLRSALTLLHVGIYFSVLHKSQNLIT